MNYYSSKSGKMHGATGFEIGDDFIVIEIKNKRKYKYTYNSAGAEEVEEMKKLALGQKGLTSYLKNRNPNYEIKF